MIAMNERLTTGPDGSRLIQHYESCRLTAYPDPATGGAPWTIGWGETKGVTRGMTITQAQADEMLRHRLTADFEPAVRRAVCVPLTQRQFDALVSAVYNIGPGLLTGTTIIGKLNAYDMPGAAAEFPRWNKAGGKVMKGLQRRREAERGVFLGQPAEQAITDALAMFP
jgi:lysozyme